MGLFSRAPKHPHWADFFTPDEYADFKRLLLASSNGEIDPDEADNNGVLKYGDISIGLANLAAQCNDLELSEWDAEITRWVELFKGGGDRPQPLYPRDMHMLKLQLYPSGYFDGLTSRPVFREDIPGVLTSVMVDWPDALISLSGDDNAEWLSHKDEVISTLLEELAKEDPYDVSFLPLSQDSDEVIAVIESGDIMTTTHSLVLDKLYPQLIGEAGALVGMPFRHMIIVKKLDQQPAEGLIGYLDGMVKHMANQNQHPVSDQLYLFKNGKFSKVTQS